MSPHSWTAEPPVAFPISLRGKATLTAGTEAFELPFITLSRSKYDSADPWHFRGMIDSDLAHDIADALHRHWRQRDVSLSGITDSGEPFRIADATYLGFSGRELYLDVQLIDFGERLLDWDPETQELSVYLTSTELIHRRASEKGILQRHYYPEQEPFTWVSSIGTHEIVRIEQSERVTVEGSVSTVEVPSVVIYSPVREILREPSAICDQIQTALPPLLGVLSLLSRKRVDYSRIVVTSRALDAEPVKVGDFSRWIRTPAREQATPAQYPLANTFELDRDEISRMASQLAAHRGAKHLMLAINFLPGLYGTAFFEARILAAFTALEAVVAALASKEREPEEKAAYELLQLLRADLSRHSVGKSPAAIERAEHSLETLTRKPIAKRVAAMAADLEVKTADLWLPSVGVEAGITKAFRQRNAILHRGEILDPPSAWVAAVKVRALAERFIYAVLGGDPAKIYPRADDYLRQLP